MFFTFHLAGKLLRLAFTPSAQDTVINYSDAITWFVNKAVVVSDQFPESHFTLRAGRDAYTRDDESRWLNLPPGTLQQ